MGVWLTVTLHMFASDQELWKLTLDEDTTTVAKILGAPAQTGEANPGHFSWYLQIDNGDNHDHSHVLLFRKSDRKLVSVTRNYDQPTNVDELFQAANTKTYFWQSGAQPRWPIRVRFVSAERALIAMGVGEHGELTSQVLLIRRNEIVNYLPWLAEQLKDR